MGPIRTLAMLNLSFATSGEPIAFTRCHTVPSHHSTFQDDGGRHLPATASSLYQ